MAQAPGDAAAVQAGHPQQDDAAEEEVPPVLHQPVAPPVLQQPVAPALAGAPGRFCCRKKKIEIAAELRIFSSIRYPGRPMESPWAPYGGPWGIPGIKDGGPGDPQV